MILLTSKYLLWDPGEQYYEDFKKSFLNAIRNGLSKEDWEYCNDLMKNSKNFRQINNNIEYINITFNVEVDILKFSESFCDELKKIEQDPEKKFIKLEKPFIIKLSSLSADYVGELVSVDCQITGEQSQKALPKTIIITCKECLHNEECNVLDIIGGSEKLLFGDLNKTLQTLLCQKCNKRTQHTIRFYTDYSIIYVRDLLEKKDKFSQGVYKIYTIHLIGKTLPRAKIVNICGKVVINPNNRDISIIADKITPFKTEIENFQITEENKENWKKYFGVEGIQLYKQINPDIVGEKRKIAKKAVITQLHSLCQIYDIERKKLIRGGINIAFIGDTKNGKSEIAKDITNKGFYELGELAEAETSSRAGLLYTIDTEKSAILWGTLPLNDMGLIVIDGLQKFSSDEIGQFREAIEQQEVIVNRSVKGNAMARVRILACLNPGKNTERAMDTYLYKCQAIRDTFVFSKNADITRFDLYIPFCDRDVSDGEITQRTIIDEDNRLIPKDIFLSHISWAWSRKPENIIYTKDAIKEIKKLSEEILTEYSMPTLPLVHKGIREVLTRFSVAKASELHSVSDNHEDILVESNHVKLAVEQYKEILDALQLKNYKLDVEGEINIIDNELISMVKDFGETEYRILNEIKYSGKSSSQLGDILEKVPKTVKEHYNKLKKHGLIETITGKGISLTSRGIKFVKWVIENEGNIVTKDVPNGYISNEKGDHVPSEV